MEEVREQLPAKTTPTWEMELLISGATIFGLLQLPDAIDRLYFRVVNFSPQDYYGVLMPLHLYSKGAVITLVLTFLAHLSLRGYWVALVGMNSVYPGGIRWDKLNLGPIAYKRLAQAKDGGIGDAIERADNRATRVFGIGVTFALFLAALTSMALIGLAAGLAVNVAFGEGYSSMAFAVVIALLALPGFLSWMLDRRFGEQLLARPSAGRVVDAVVRFYIRRGLGPRSNPLIALFRSQVGGPRFAATAALVFLPVFLLIIVQSSLSRGELPFGLFVGLSGKSPYAGNTSPNAFYEDQRSDPWVSVPLPHIRSRVVDGPYVQLFVPFIPRLHGAALVAACPELHGAGAADGSARLVCLSRMIALQVDGAPVAVALDASTDPATGQPGVLAMLPVEALPSGRHELSLNAPTDPGNPRQRYRIAFWK